MVLLNIDLAKPPAYIFKNENVFKVSYRNTPNAVKTYACMNSIPLWEPTLKTTITHMVGNNQETLNFLTGSCSCGNFKKPHLISLSRPVFYKKNEIFPNP